MPVWAVLDPVLFDPGLSGQEAGQVIREVARLVRRPDWSIPEVELYWPSLWSDWIQPFKSRLAGEERWGLDELRYHTSVPELPDLPAEVEVTGFSRMFSRLGAAWLETMQRVVARCLAAANGDTCVVSRLIEGRNLKTHYNEHVQLREKLTWRVATSVEGARRTANVVCNSRNADQDWTCRFDEDLPAEDDGSSYPFCPPSRWADPCVPAFETHEARLAWRDANGNHWADPNTPGFAQHWDVYLNASQAEKHGLGQLNIGRFGTSKVGKIHHVPTKKQGRLRSRSGWSC